MKIGFDVGELNERGTTVASFDYARFAKALLGHEPVLFHCAGKATAGKATNEAALARISRQIQCLPYGDDAASVFRGEGLDVLYRIGGGEFGYASSESFWIANHIVFQNEARFKNTSAYVSEWLSRFMSGGQIAFVPHIVDLPEPGRDLRQALSIPREAFVVGRYGGYDQFNLDFVPRVIAQIVAERRDIWFIFANTRPFLRDERVIFLPVMFEAAEKSAFIEACDIMLHARHQGESFGLSMAEFIARGRQVMTWCGGIDRNHLVLQPDRNYVYFSAFDLYRKLKTIRSADLRPLPPESRGRFAPEVVMQKFDAVFLRPGEPQAPRHVARGVRYLKRRKVRLINEASKAVSRLFRPRLWPAAEPSTH